MDRAYATAHRLLFIPAQDSGTGYRAHPEIEEAGRGPEEAVRRQNEHDGNSVRNPVRRGVAQDPRFSNGVSN